MSDTEAAPSSNKHGVKRRFSRDESDGSDNSGSEDQDGEDSAAAARPALVHPQMRKSSPGSAPAAAAAASSAADPQAKKKRRTADSDIATNGQTDVADQSGQQKRPRPKSFAHLDYIERPKYEFFSRLLAGGKRSTAIIGPVGLLPKGENANPKLPKDITAARKKYPESYFKAGHLLNGEFGGPGKEAKNLTILSAAGNRDHTNFDNPVKEALGTLKELYKYLSKSLVDIDQFKCGVKVVVERDGSWGPAGIEYSICATLKCSAALVGGEDSVIDNLVEMRTQMKLSDLAKMTADAVNARFPALQHDECNALPRILGSAKKYRTIIGTTLDRAQTTIINAQTE